MYVIIVYDAAPARGAKLLRLLRRWLTWVQNSVFEGELTSSQFFLLEASIADIVEDDDSVLCYTFGSKMYAERLVFGREKNPTDAFL